jgi:hypothetical protein
MIFRRGKKADVEETDDSTSAADETPGAEESTAAGSDLAGSDTHSADDDSDGTAGSDPDVLDEEALDAQDWRADGPWDASEVELEEDEPDPAHPRIDLGSMVVTGFPGAELRLQMSEETQQIVSAMLVHGDSALELGAYAAPRSGGLWSELREEIMASATEAGGSASLAEGPFGVELRRLIPVTTPEGEQGYQPSRMWVAEGPRWLLRGIVYGQAALEDGTDSP